MSAMLVYVTCRSEEEARAIARVAVGERLAACANILGAIRSLYWWEGSLEEGEEAALILKTRDDLVAPLTARIKETHGYSVPCVAALPIIAGNPDYLAWIESETR
jgi:periplasmic divalent cation tolerance protein